MALACVCCAGCPVKVGQEKREKGAGRGGVGRGAGWGALRGARSRACCLVKGGKGRGRRGGWRRMADRGDPSSGRGAAVQGGRGVGSLRAWLGVAEGPMRFLPHFRGFSLLAAVPAVPAPAAGKRRNLAEMHPNARFFWAPQPPIKPTANKCPARLAVSKMPIFSLWRKSFIWRHFSQISPFACRWLSRAFAALATAFTPLLRIMQRTCLFI